MDIDYTLIGKRLKAIRGKVTLREFAERTGYTISYINNCERGQKPSLELLCSVAANFDVSLDWLVLGKIDIRPKKDEISDIFQDEIIGILQSLGPEGKALLVGMTKTILQNSGLLAEREKTTFTLNSSDYIHKEDNIE